MLKQAKEIIKNLSINKKYLNEKIMQNKKFQWSKKIKNRKKLDKFYEIKINDTKSDIEKKIKATYTNLYKPFIKLHGYIFEFKKTK